MVIFIVMVIVIVMVMIIRRLTVTIRVIVRVIVIVIVIGERAMTCQKLHAKTTAKKLERKSMITTNPCF